MTNKNEEKYKLSFKKQETKNYHGALEKKTAHLWAIKNVRLIT